MCSTLSAPDLIQFSGTSALPLQPTLRGWSQGSVRLTPRMKSVRFTTDDSVQFAILYMRSTRVRVGYCSIEDPNSVMSRVWYSRYAQRASNGIEPQPCTTTSRCHGQGSSTAQSSIHVQNVGALRPKNVHLKCEGVYSTVLPTGARQQVIYSGNRPTPR